MDVYLCVLTQTL